VTWLRIRTSGGRCSNGSKKRRNTGGADDRTPVSVRVATTIAERKLQRIAARMGGADDIAPLCIHVELGNVVR
jgi:hypothetical protein